MSIYTDATILVTGGTGSIGSRVVAELLKHAPRAIRILSRNEEKQFWMRRKYLGRTLRFLIGDIRDRDRLSDAMHGVDYVFHCAAMKHVDMCQYNPQEANKTNVDGTMNVLRAATHAGVKRLVHLSTDKIVQPNCVMAATKLAAEQTVLAHNRWQDRPVCIVARMGNVLYSSGSLAQIICRCVRLGKRYTLTDPDMRRYFISGEDAARWLLCALMGGDAGDIWIPRMTEWRIGDLAPRIARQCAAAYKVRYKYADDYLVIGARPWENMREELWTAHEAVRLRDVDGGWVIPL